MGRPHRVALGGYVYHVLNRANGRLPIFQKDGDYAAFERILAEALEHVPGIRLLCYCLMPNHWHLLLWPRADGELSDFGHWLTLTHTQRWHAHYRDAGTGHLYQGRFKSFPVVQDEHFLQVCRYVERNALRAGLVRRAEAWRWCSLWHRQQAESPAPSLLSPWPLAEPSNWLQEVDRAQSEAELEALRRCVQRGQPYGPESWSKRVAKRLGLESTFRPRGRPAKRAESKRRKGS
ncbi:MAG TPA: transposase [Gemmataceae bacterium]|nr:transposase [Gemmataceae bacterium]